MNTPRILEKDWMWASFPFVLLSRSSSKKRNKWVKLLKRVNQDKAEWKPSNSDRVCSEHFVDKIPSETNPDPTMHLGYDLPKNAPSRRKLFRHPPPTKEKPVSNPIKSQQNIYSDYCCFKTVFITFMLLSLAVKTFATNSSFFPLTLSPLDLKKDFNSSTFIFFTISYSIFVSLLISCCLHSLKATMGLFTFVYFVPDKLVTRTHRPCIFKMAAT